MELSELAVALAKQTWGWGWGGWAHQEWVLVGTWVGAWVGVWVGGAGREPEASFAVRPSISPCLRSSRITCRMAMLCMLIGTARRFLSPSIANGLPGTYDSDIPFSFFSVNEYSIDG